MSVLTRSSDVLSMSPVAVNEPVTAIVAPTLRLVLSSAFSRLIESFPCSHFTSALSVDPSTKAICGELAPDSLIFPSLVPEIVYAQYGLPVRFNMSLAYVAVDSTTADDDEPNVTNPSVVLPEKAIPPPTESA